MASFCITGINPRHLSWIEELFTSSGMTPATHSAQNDRISFGLWHEKVSSHTLTTKSTSPGRLWDQLASELFLANIESENWFWSDTRSALYLNYWLGFDPSVQFILVYCTPQYFLKTAILTSNKKLSFQELINEWMSYYQSILHFYSQNKTRCLLIDIEEAMQFPNELVSFTEKQFGINLDRKALGPSTTPEIKSSIEFLLNTLLLKQKDILAFQAQFERNLQILRPKQEQTLSWFDRLKAPLLGHSSRQLLTNLNSDIVIEDLRLLCYKPNLDSEINTENKYILEQINSSNFEIQAELNASQDLVKLGQGELNTSLTRIAQLEEELNQVHLQKNAMTSENEAILMQLHQTQEELEKYFFEHKRAEQSLEAVRKRWDRLLQREPGYFDFEAMQVNLIDDQDPLQISRWFFSDLSIGKVHLSALELTIQCAPNKPLKLTIKGGSDSELADLGYWYPSSAPNSEEFKLSSVNISQTSALASADFESLCTIPAFLMSILEAPEYFQIPNEVNPQGLIQNLEKLDDLLSKAKKELRMEGVSLRNEQTNPDYEHLWLEVEDLFYDGKTIEKFDFRISCANVRPNKFGTHPKLEIPAQTDTAIFKSWFEESVDDFGPKYELRFALPDSMDLQVLQKLSIPDQQFIEALLNKLPALLDRLEARRTHFNRNIDDWRALGSSMLSIFNKATKPSALEAKTMSKPKVSKKKIAAKKVATKKMPSKKVPSKQVLEEPPANIRNVKSVSSKEIKSKKAPTKSTLKPIADNDV
jgi:hypothetical protein